MHYRFCSVGDADIVETGAKPPEEPNPVESTGPAADAKPVAEAPHR